MMKKIFAIGIIAFAIIGCEGTAEVRALNSLAIACDTYAEVGNQLVPMRKSGKLSKGTISKVNKSNSVVEPVCSGKNRVVDPETAIQVVNQGISLLKAIKGE